MIAEIDNQADIQVFLEKDELERIKTERIIGVLVKTHKPKRQGTLGIFVNNARSYEKGCGVGIDDSKYWGVKDGFHVEVFVGFECYGILKEQGVVGIRQRMRDGSKITLYDRARCDYLDNSRAEDLEFYRDNKDRLLEEFG